MFKAIWGAMNFVWELVYSFLMQLLGDGFWGNLFSGLIACASVFALILLVLRLLIELWCKIVNTLEGGRKREKLAMLAQAAKEHLENQCIVNQYSLRDIVAIEVTGGGQYSTCKSVTITCQKDGRNKNHFKADFKALGYVIESRSPCYQINRMTMEEIVKAIAPDRFEVVTDVIKVEGGSYEDKSKVILEKNNDGSYTAQYRKGYADGYTDYRHRIVSKEAIAREREINRLVEEEKKKKITRI